MLLLESGGYCPRAVGNQAEHMMRVKDLGVKDLGVKDLGAKVGYRYAKGLCIGAGNRACSGKRGAGFRSASIKREG